MSTARLMDSPQDYVRIGVKPDEVEPWEDQQRNGSAAGQWEWWYFDAIMVDGTAVVIQFFTKGFSGLDKPGLQPSGVIEVTLPDGTHHERDFDYPVDECRFRTGKCDITIGPHSFIGDLADYTIHVDPIDGLGADLSLHSLGRPYRPGTAYFGFGDNDDHYFTWLCAVPKGQVSGTLTVDSQTLDVTGFGYHDHQWGSNIYFKLWNHWLWARQRLDDYTILVFDLVASAPYDYTRFPIAFIQDNEGNIVFQNTHDVTYEVISEYHDDNAGTDYPKVSRYTFRADDTTVDYTLSVNKVLESNSLSAVATNTLRKHLGTLL